MPVQMRHSRVLEMGTGSYNIPSMLPRVASITKFRASGLVCRSPHLDRLYRIDEESEHERLKVEWPIYS